MATNKELYENLFNMCVKQVRLINEIELWKNNKRNVFYTKEQLKEFFEEKHGSYKDNTSKLKESIVDTEWKNKQLERQLNILMSPFGEQY